MNFDWIIESILFCNFDRPPVNAIGWTLQFEFLFYILITLFIFLKIKFRKLFVLVLFISAYFITHTFETKYQVISSPLLIEFLIGMLCYDLYRDRVFDSPAWIMISLLCFFIGLYIWLNTNFGSSVYGRVFTAGVAGGAALIFSLRIAHFIKVPKVLENLGNASYGLYLAHWVFMPIVSHFAFMFIGDFFLLYVLTIFIFFQVLSLLIYRFIDLPVHRWLLRVLEIRIYSSVSG